MQDHLIEDFEFEINKLFENEEKYKDYVNGDNGVLICGFFMDGVKWNFDTKRIVDSEKRFNVAPYFLCRVTQVNKIQLSINFKY